MNKWVIVVKWAIFTTISWGEQVAWTVYSLKIHGLLGYEFFTTITKKKQFLKKGLIFGIDRALTKSAFIRCYFNVFMKLL
jgi:hypothetical protein